MTRPRPPRTFLPHAKLSGRTDRARPLRSAQSHSKSGRAPVLNITNHVTALADMIHDLRDTQSRVLVGVAGAPASGKSTLAEEVAKRLRLQRCPAHVVPMDGFHLDNDILDARGLRARKGAPETFDAQGFVLMVDRLRKGQEVVIPRFDRARDIAIAGATAVAADCPVVLVEGNYLLFDEYPWAQLAPLWDIAAYIDVPIEDLRSRLIQRWLTHGLSRTAATKRAEGNDIPNAQRVIDRALPADLILTTGQN